MLKANRDIQAAGEINQQTQSLRQRLAQRRKDQHIRKDLVAFTIFVVFFAAVVGFLVGLASSLNGSLKDGLKAGVGTTLGISYTALSFKYPRYALWAFLIYLPFGGTITYLIGNSPLLQLAKDGFYIPALIGVLQYCRRERLPIIVSKPLAAPLVILLLSCLLTLVFVNGFNQFSLESGEQPLAMGILGLKVLVGYVPLVVCAYYLIRDRHELQLLLRLMVTLILICCGLAFIQYLLLRTGYCPGTRFEEGSALFKASLEARCFVGGSLLYSPEYGQIRLPGTFVAPWQWGWFLISSGFLAFAPAFNDPKPYWRSLGLVSLAAVFIMALLSGQRIALVLVPATFSLLVVMTGQVIQLKRFIPTAFGLLVLLSFVLLRNPAMVQERLNSLESRWSASPPHEFIVNQFAWVTRSHLDGFIGNGLGKATNSARVFGDTRLIETYYPKLLYEIGPLGTIAFLLFVTVLVSVTWQAYRSLRDRDLRNYGATFWVFLLFISYNTYYYPLDVDPVAVYYWFFAGVILRLPEIERQERLDALESEQPQHRRRRRLKRKGFA
jgi:hypothetical protein